MKMINDMDLYYADSYAKYSMPNWMRAEKLDFCDQKTIDHRADSFLRSFLRKKAN